ncbi:hypothetical protein X948_5205 [Burkholderia pseudomallei MSHR5608]|nr:hypothetical protein X948_5205 [Burkholderia pseudomallei MSHR5608]
MNDADGPPIGRASWSPQCVVRGWRVTPSAANRCCCTRPIRPVATEWWLTVMRGPGFRIGEGPVGIVQRVAHVERRTFQLARAYRTRHGQWSARRDEQPGNLRCVNRRQMAGAAIRRPEGGRHALKKRGHAQQIAIAARHARIFERRASVKPRATRHGGSASFYLGHAHAATRVVRASSHASTSATTKPMARGPSFTGRGNVPALMRRRTSLSLRPTRSSSAGIRTMRRGWIAVAWN